MSCPLTKDPFVGRSGRHRLANTPKTLRTALVVAAGIAVVALAAITTAVTGSGASSAQTKSRTAAAYPPRLVDRASRGGLRTPIATPTPEPTETPPAPEAHPVHEKGHILKILSRGA